MMVFALPLGDHLSPTVHVVCAKIYIRFDFVHNVTEHLGRVPVVSICVFAI